MNQARSPFSELVDSAELKGLIERLQQISGVALTILDHQPESLALRSDAPSENNAEPHTGRAVVPLMIDGERAATIVAQVLPNTVPGMGEAGPHNGPVPTSARADATARLVAHIAELLGNARSQQHSAQPEPAPSRRCALPGQLLISAVSVAIFQLDRHRRVVQANPQMAEVFGLPLERLLGSDLAELFAEDERETVASRLTEWSNGHAMAIDDECAFVRANGTRFLGRLSGRRIVANERQIGTVFSLSEITRKSGEADFAGDAESAVGMKALVNEDNVTLDDLFDRAEMQRIQDDFASAFGVASGITYPDGRRFTRESNGSRLCSQLIRQTATGCANCARSDAVIGRHHPQGPIVQRCLSGGLWDAGASIMVGDRHIGNWLMGQIRDEVQTEAGIRTYAREIGADEEAMAEAFAQIPAISRDRFERIAQALFTMAGQLSKQAFQNLQQARLINELNRVQKELKLAANVFTHAREGIMITSADGLIVDVNEAFSAITGYRRDEALGQSPRFLHSGRHSEAFYTDLWHELTTKGHWYGEIWNRRKNGEVYAVMQTISTVHGAHGKATHYVALFSDITLLKEHANQLEHIAHYDALTTLPNRVLLADRLHQAMRQTQRRGESLAVAYLDLDGFKVINDSYGHEVGDQLLVTVAGRMKAVLREGDTLARLGGDEFVAVLLDVDNVPASLPMLNRLLDAAALPVAVGEHQLRVSASIGLTFYPQTDDTDADHLLRQSDQAMYQAKLAGKNRFHVFDAEQDRNVRGLHESFESIRRALGANEFVLFYQPKVNMRTGEIIGAEALIRWAHPERGMLPPAVFLPVIEDHPLAVTVGEWVIETALTQLDAWRAAGLDIPISVNVGARQLQQPDFVARLCALIARHPSFRHGDLELEVLETSALEDLARVSEVIQLCHGIGVSFALDDFGTGYSSLTYLKRLAVAQLKIDQSFVRDMLDDPDDLAILGGVLGLATALRRQVIAEGVATIPHGTMLLQLGCELAQGYGIAHPMPAADFPIWAANWHPDPTWINQPPIDRDDFPLLFAGAEHRAWLQAICQFIDGQRDTLPLVHYQCHFLRWLENEGRERHAENPAFAGIEAHHRELHRYADSLCDLYRQGQAATAREGKDNLRTLLDALIEQLQQLARRR